MRIVCRDCGHSEKTTKEFFVKLIGGVLPIGGYWAWVTYFFAGTGFAMPLVIAMIAGGTTLLVFKDEIVEWVSNLHYQCPKCGKVNWTS